VQTSSAIHRVLEILLLYQDGKERRSIDEISQALGLPKSTTYRFMRILQESGFLEKAGSSHYQLGAALLKLSRVALNSNRDIRLMALPAMQRIAQKVGESVSLMRLMNHQVVCIESIEGQQALRVSIEQGRTQPLHAGASSRVLLAHLPEDEWEDYLQFPLTRLTDATMTSIDTLYENLRAVREVGYAVSNGEIDLGARAIAVPLYNNRDEVVAALSIEAPAMRMSDETVQRYLQILKLEADQLRHGL
jgi:IclR family transcriptional regulator, acetate operon repressor